MLDFTTKSYKDKQTTYGWGKWGKDCRCYSSQKFHWRNAKVEESSWFLLINRFGKFLSSFIHDIDIRYENIITEFLNDTKIFQQLSGQIALAKNFSEIFQNDNGHWQFSSFTLRPILIILADGKLENFRCAAKRRIQAQFMKFSEKGLAKKVSNTFQLWFSPKFETQFQEC